MSSKDQLSLFPTSERTVLWIIAKNPDAFTISFFLEVGHQASLSGIMPESNLAKALAIGTSLQQRGFIKIGVDRTTITFRGQMYRLVTHPSFVFWTFVATILAIGVSILIWRIPSTESTPKEQKGKPAAADSLRDHQKGVNIPSDSAKGASSKKHPA